MFNSGTIDTISSNDDKSEVILGLSHLLPWEGSADQRTALSDKFSTYIHFIGSGQLLEHIQPKDGYRVKIILYCLPTDNPSTLEFLKNVQRSLKRLDLGFLVRAKTPTGVEWYPLRAIMLDIDVAGIGAPTPRFAHASGKRHLTGV